MPRAPPSPSVVDIRRCTAPVPWKACQLVLLLGSSGALSGPAGVSATAMAQGQRRCTAGLALQAESIAAAGVKQQLGSCQGRAAVSDLPLPTNTCTGTHRASDGLGVGGGGGLAALAEGLQ